MPRLRTYQLIVALLIAGAACSNKPPAAPSPSPTATQTPAPTPVATNPSLSEPEALLLQACAKGDIKAVRELLDKGVNVNARDRDGRQPIIEATYWQHADIVKLLIERAADVNARKVDGATALMFAIELRNKEIERMLRQAGAKADPVGSAETKQPGPAARPSPPPKAQ